MTAAALTSYVPQHVQRRIAAGGPPNPPYAERVTGAVLLGDVRGFTSLTERMAERGPDGVETLTAAMNRYFGGMIDRIGEHGGEVVSFAGDALLALWPDGELAPALDAAADCALELAGYNAGVEAGLDAPLQVRLAVAAGGLDGIQVGRGQVYNCLMGRPLERVAEAIEYAAAGEVAVDAAGWELLAPHAEGRACPDGSRVLRAVHAERRARPAAPFVLDIADSALAPYIAPSVLAREAAVQEQRWIAELRRVTSIFLSLPDLVEGVELDAVQGLIVALQADFERHQAQLNQLTVDNKGASLLAATGLPPHAHANDPERGVRTALAIAETLRELGWRGSVGVATGRALCGLIGNQQRREYTILGDFVNVSARLSAAGDQDEVSVLCDAATFEATDHRIEYEPPRELTVKGKARPIAAHRPLGRRISTVTADTAPVGRRSEQDVLGAAIERAAAGGGGAIAIQAEPGFGKSRLLADTVALARRRGLRCLTGAGDPIEVATPYHGWLTVFAALLGVTEEPGQANREAQARAALGARAPLLNSVLGLDLPDSDITAPLQAERRIHATRELLLELLTGAAAEPLLIAIDDAHWLDSASWALLRDVVRGGLPALVVVATRPTAAPEYAQLDALRLELGPLATEDALAMACDRLGAATLDPTVESMILERAGGNPLFVEEIARALRQSDLVAVSAAGVCEAAPGADLRTLELPGTVEGVIANRMQGLEPHVDLALKVAAAIGQTCTAELVRDVYPVAAGVDGIDTWLDALVRRDLLEAVGHGAFTFRHALIRDVAYERLLFEQRRTLHLAIGEWHERRFAGNLAPVYATLAHHFTQAADVERACDYLGRASVQAANNGMSREAVDLGLSAARMLGVDLPRALPEVQAAIGERVGAIAALMEGRSIDSLADLPPAGDPALAGAIGVLLQTAPAAFLSSQAELFALMGLEAFRLTLQEGATPYTPGVFALYALLTRAMNPDPRPALALASLALRLAERDSPPLRGYAGFVHSWFVRHWLEPLEPNLPRLLEHSAAGFEHGDVMFGCFNQAAHVVQLAASGAHLDEVIETGTRAADLVAGRVASAMFHCVHETQYAKALAGRTTDRCSFTDGTLDEERDIASILHTDMHNQQGYYLASKLRLHFYYREYERAIAFGEQAEPLLPSFAGQQQEAEFVFFFGLALFTGAPERGEAMIERMRGWAAFAPDLFAWRVQIMEGVRDADAALLERGAEGAPRHHAALARELAGRLRGDTEAARELLRAARDGYAEWGASAKADDVAAALG